MLLNFLLNILFVGVHFFGRPKKRTKERRLETPVSKNFWGGALPFLSLVIKKADGGAPNEVCRTNSGQKVRPEFVVAYVPPRLDATV